MEEMNEKDLSNDKVIVNESSVKNTETVINPEEIIEKINEIDDQKKKIELFFKLLRDNKKGITKEQLKELLESVGVVFGGVNLITILMRLYLLDISKELRSVAYKFINSKCNKLYFDSLVFLTEDKKREIFNYETEEEILHIVKQLDNQLGDNYFSEKRFQLMLIYLWYSTSLLIKKDYKLKSKLHLLDKAIIDYTSNTDELADKIYSYVPREMLKSSFTSFNNIKAVYYKKDEQYNELQEQLQNVKSVNSNLSKERQELLQKTYMNRVQIDELNKQILELNSRIENLEKEKEINEGKLTFERNQNEDRMDNLRNDIIEDLQDSIKLELEGIEDIIENIDERSKTKIERRIRRILKRMERD